MFLSLVNLISEISLPFAEVYPLPSHEATLYSIHICLLKKFFLTFYFVLEYSQLLHGITSCMHAQSLQSCPTLCDTIDSRLPGSSVHGILQGENTGVGCHALLQGIFPVQGSNPWSLLHLLHHR